MTRPDATGAFVADPTLNRISGQRPHVEVFAVDFVFGRQWGYQCFTCGFEQTGVMDFLTAEEHSETHRCGTALNGGTS